MQYKKALDIMADKNCHSVDCAHMMIDRHSDFQPFQDWCKDHMFVFMWLPIIIISEIVIPLLAILGVIVGFFLSWDRKYRTVTSYIWRLGVMNSELLGSMDCNGLCPFCPEHSSDEVLKQMPIRKVTKFHKGQVWGARIWEKDTKPTLDWRISESSWTSLQVEIDNEHMPHINQLKS